MKKWISTIVLVLLAAYIVVAAVAFSGKPADQVCQGVKLEIADSVAAGYLTTADVLALLRQNGLDPTGKLMDEVSLRDMEKLLASSPQVRNSECYKTIGGYVVVDIEFRKPILRVIANSGDSFYLDEEGELIEHISKAVYLPLATGHVTREFAKKELLSLAHYLQTDDFWRAQIEQMHVTERHEIELIPRVGGHTIVLGKPGNYEYKFNKLYTFYEKGLCEMGWKRYARINLDYNNQVIGTKRK